MKIEQRQNLLQVLKLAQAAIKKGDVAVLRELSNRTIHDASIFQDETDVLIAVVMYSLSKIHERDDYKLMKNYQIFCNDCLKNFSIAYQYLQKNEFDKFETQLKSFLKSVNKLDNKLKTNIKYVIEMAKIHKASRLHEHGVSVGKTAELLGISQFELMDYVGKTGIADVKENITLDINQRLNLARGVFK